MSRDMIRQRNFYSYVFHEVVNDTYCIFSWNLLMMISEYQKFEYGQKFMVMQWPIYYSKIIAIFILLTRRKKQRKKQ